MSYRIGISMRVTNAQGYDEKRDSIAQDWTKYMLSVFPESKWLLIPNIGKQAVNYFKEWDLNVLFLSGGDDIGKFQIRDETELELIKYAISKSIPIVAICRGMQLIHNVFNGKIKKGNDEFIQNHGGNSHCISIEGQQYEVNSYHNNYIDEESLHNSFKVFSRCSIDKSPEGFHNKYILAMMWHPERESKPSKWNEILIKNFLDENKY